MHLTTLTSDLPAIKKKVIVHELISEGELTSVRAEEKTGTSWYLMQAAVSWSAGRPFLRYMPVGLLKILFIDCDLAPDQAGFRFRSIERVLGYKACNLDFISLRADIKNWELLVKVLAPAYDLYILDGAHWFGKQYEMVTYLRQSNKTILASESFRHTSVDKRTLFGYSPYDSVITILPHWLENYKVLEVKTRNHVQRKKTSLLCMENLIEVSDNIDPKIREKYKRYFTIAELYLKILDSLSWPTGANWISALPHKSLLVDFKSTINWLIKHELVFRKGQRYFISTRGRALMDSPEYDPSMSTIEEISTELDYSSEDIVIDRFGPIQKNYPIPLKLKLKQYV